MQEYTECLYEIINGKEIRINACRGYGDTAVIPEEIGGLPLTELGAYVFSSSRRKMPEGIWSGEELWSAGSGGRRAASSGGGTAEGIDSSSHSEKSGGLRFLQLRKLGEPDLPQLLS